MRYPEDNDDNSNNLPRSLHTHPRSVHRPDPGLKSCWQKRSIEPFIPEPLIRKLQRKKEKPCPCGVGDRKHTLHQLPNGENKKSAALLWDSCHKQSMLHEQCYRCGTLFASQGFSTVISPQFQISLTTQVDATSKKSALISAHVDYTVGVCLCICNWWLTGHSRLDSILAVTTICSCGDTAGKRL